MMLGLAVFGRGGGDGGGGGGDEGFLGGSRWFFATRRCVLGDTK